MSLPFHFFFPSKRALDENLNFIHAKAYLWKLWDNVRTKESCVWIFRTRCACLFPPIRIHKLFVANKMKKFSPKILSFLSLCALNAIHKIPLLITDPSLTISIPFSFHLATFSEPAADATRCQGNSIKPEKKFMTSQKLYQNWILANAEEIPTNWGSFHERNWGERDFSEARARSFLQLVSLSNNASRMQINC